MTFQYRFANAMALTAVVGILTAVPEAEAQVVDAAPPSYHRTYHRRRHRHVHHSAAAPAAAPAAPVIAAPAIAVPVIAAPAIAAPVIAAPVIAATPADQAPAAPRTEVPATLTVRTGTPLPLRPSRALSLAHDGAYQAGGWKLLLGFAGLGLAFALWRRRAPTSAISNTCEIQVVTRTTIGHRCELVVVEVGGQRLLLGVTSGSVQYLAAVNGGAPAPTARDASKTADFESMFAAARSAKTRSDTARPRDAAPERPRETDRPKSSVVNTQSLRSDTASRRAAPEGQIQGLLALGAYR